MKLGLLTASLVLVAGGAVGCGDDDSSGGGSAKDDATASASASSDDGGTSTDDFCGAFAAFSDDLEGLTGEEPNLGEILKEAAQRIEDAGTPEDISDDAKEGLQLTLDAIAALPDDATAEDMTTLEQEFSEDEKAKTDAFSDYLEKTCPDLGGSGAPESDSGSGYTSDPSDTASDDSGSESDGGS